MKKLICVVGMMFVAGVVMAAEAPAAKPAGKTAVAAPAAAAPAAPAAEAWKTKVFTLEELATFDGKEGRAAYVAVDGVVYDLTKVPSWKGGSHMRKHAAGKDLSDDYHNNAPKKIHDGRKIIEKMPKVGVLAPKDEATVAAPEAVPGSAPAAAPVTK